MLTMNFVDPHLYLYSEDILQAPPDKPITGVEPWTPLALAITALAVAAFTSIYHVLQETIRTPRWLKPFVEEPRKDAEVDEESLKTLPSSTICLCLLACAGTIGQCVLVIWLRWQIISTVAWALAALDLIVRRPRTAPALSVLFFVMMVAAQVFLLAAKLHTDETLWNIISILNIFIPFLAAVVAINMSLRDPSLPSHEISKAGTTPTAALRSPEDNITLWQWSSVSWMSSIISTGSDRQLNESDIYSLPYDFLHTHLHSAFRELRGSVMRRLLIANGLDLVILALLAVLELVATFAQPLLLQQLLLSMEVLHTTKQPAIIYGTITLVASLVATQTGIFSLWYGRRCYERSRGEMIMMLYEKTLVRKVISGVNNEGNQENNEEDLRKQLPDTVEGVENSMNDIINTDEVSETTPLLESGSSNDRSAPLKIKSKPLQRLRNRFHFSQKKKAEPGKKLPASMGKIVNMFRNDAYEIAQRFLDSPALIKKPVGLILALALSWQLIGWSIIVGMIIVVIAQVLNAVLARMMMSWEKTRRKATDDRLQRTSQFIEALRHLRWYGWQETWLLGIMEARQRELRQRVIGMFLRMGINLTSIIASGLLPVAAFYGYTKLAHHELRIDIAFPALALFDMLQKELRDLPQLITSWLNAMVAVGRLEDFMKEPNMTESIDSRQSNGIRHDSISTIDSSLQPIAGSHFELKDATFAWPGTNATVLNNVSLTFRPGLNVIYGSVGAGKSALLQGLLGELDLSGGELVRPSTPLGYCAQTPWLQSMSIRDNILFSSPYDHTRYQETIEVCALKPDFSNLKHGDLSEIGENGIGLSGGQKARVALARAIYSRTEFLLLDDPLSALDQQTAEWIARKCLAGNLVKGRVVILVTHRTDLCQDHAEQLIEVSQKTARVVSKAPAALTQVKSYESKDPNDNSVSQSEKQPEPETEATKFMEEEKRESGGIRWIVYWEFIVAGGAWTWIALAIVDVIFHGLVFVRNWLLKAWGEAYGREGTAIRITSISNYTHHPLTTSESSTPISRFFDRLPSPADNPTPWLAILTIVVFVQSAAWAGDQQVMVVLIYATGKKMFRRIINRVTNAVFRFYDVTPVGRLMNRMTSDVGNLDGSISGTLSNFIFWISSWLINIVILGGTTPYYLVAAALLVLGFVGIFMRFLPTSQSLRRLETVSLSPLMSNFGALVEGLTTVRAYCAQSRFLDSAIKSTDTFQKMDHFYWSLQAWLQWRFEILSAAATYAMTLLAIFTGVSPGLTAFVLRAADRLVMTTHRLCLEYGILQMDFVSVERVVELFHIEQEPKGSIDPPAWWPSTSSDIVFEDVVIRYAPHLDPALSGVSFTLKGGSSTAVIGRTGSGKSTLALALLGTIVPSSGRIFIGGIDIAEVNKQALRSRISFLAQDPVLFTGTMRKNLDPTNEHTDPECASVLERVCGRFNWSLDMEVDAGGKNLSQGQRQLVGLCRAILRRSALIIMDEATASIDKDSAWEIQRVLREELKDSTVLTIAHRKEAVRGVDYVLNLGKGKVIEMGKPDELGDEINAMASATTGREIG